MLDKLEDLYDSEYADFHMGLLEEMRSGASIDGIQTMERVYETLGLAGCLKDKLVLDIGTGVGLFALEASNRGGNVVALDFSGPMLSTARRLSQQYDVTFAGLVRAACPYIPFRNAVFDVIIIGDVVEHLLPDVLYETISQCRRLLKNEGKLVIHTAPSRYHYFFLHNPTFSWLSAPALCLPLPHTFIVFWLEMLAKIRSTCRIFKHGDAISSKEKIDIHGHINCQTLPGFQDLLKSCQFEIGRIYAKEIFMKNREFFSKSVFRLIPKRHHHYFLRSIFVLAYPQEQTDAEPQPL